MSALRLNYLQYMLRNHSSELQLDENLHLDFLQMVAEVVITQQLEAFHDNTNQHYFEQLQTKINIFNERKPSTNPKPVIQSPLVTLSCMLDCYDKNQYFLDNVKHISNHEDRNRRPPDWQKDRSKDFTKISKKSKSKKKKRSVSSKSSSSSSNSSSSRGRSKSRSNSSDSRSGSGSNSDSSRSRSGSGSNSSDSQTGSSSDSRSRRSSSSSSQKRSKPKIRSIQQQKQAQRRNHQQRQQQKAPRLRQQTQPPLVIKPQIFAQQSHQITIQKKQLYVESSIPQNFKVQEAIKPPVSVLPQMLASLQTPKLWPNAQFLKLGAQNQFPFQIFPTNQYRGAQQYQIPKNKNT